MIQLVVEGTPAPQGSKTAVVRHGHATLLEGSSASGRAAHRAWRQEVYVAAHQARVRQGKVDDDAPVAIKIAFVLPRPKSTPKRLTWCAVKPDLDKLVRSTLDGLADGGLVKHDSRVVQLVATKTYAHDGEPSGAMIAVFTVAPDSLGLVV